MKKIILFIFALTLLFINADKKESAVLIAVQKSHFKNNVINEIQNNYKGKSVNISVIDIADLSKTDIKNFSGIIIFVSVEKDKIHPKTDEFIKKNSALKNLFLVVTSDSGKWNKNGIELDAFTSASVKTNSQKYVDKIKSIIDGISK